jgi:hypothetical protein
LTGQHIVVPDEYSEIDTCAFQGRKEIKSLKINDNVKGIGAFAFAYCKSMESISLPEGITSFETSTFRDCESLKSITIPQTVTVIGDSAFSGCSSLNSIVIPENVHTIASGAFSWCKSLESITVLNKDLKIHADAFKNTKTDNLVIFCPPGSGVDIFCRNNNIKTNQEREKKDRKPNVEIAKQNEPTSNPNPNPKTNSAGKTANDRPPPRLINRDIPQKISLDKTVYTTGDKIAVSTSKISQAMRDASAFVSVYVKGAAHDAYGDYKYVKQGDNIIMLKAPKKPGKYEVRLYQEGFKYTDSTFMLSVDFSVE